MVKGIGIDIVDIEKFRRAYEKWKDSFLGILPGHSGSTLSADIAHIMWGGHRGTAPVTIWGWRPTAVLVR